MKNTLSLLLERLDHIARSGTGVIPWSSPIPCFGNLTSAAIATVGLNPSNREFVDLLGRELVGETRRFHTLSSLNLAHWSEAEKRHLDSIAAYCEQYFLRNPYDLWFRRLDYIVSGTRASYYNASSVACHLDLIPYATIPKWNALRPIQRSTLSQAAGDTLGCLVRDSFIKMLVLNGTSVVEEFEKLSDVRLNRREKKTWSLPRRSSADIKGFSYEGRISKLGGINLRRKVLVLGFNHNIQSSFGVTTKVVRMIRKWIATKATRDAL